MADAQLHIFGVRHHGPGSARSLIVALKKLKPDCILVEGPPDADELIAMAAHKEMKPPVSLLIYAADDPKKAVYYPFAEFSPEWQAIQYGLDNKVTVGFCDLPMMYQFGDDGTDARTHGGTKARREKKQARRSGAIPWGRLRKRQGTAMASAGGNMWSRLGLAPKGLRMSLPACWRR